MTTFHELSNFIYQIAELLRGPYRPPQYERVMLPMTVLRRFNEAANETADGYRLCHRGDLAINTMWAWIGAMGVSSVDSIVSPSYNVCEPSNQLVGGYVDALVRTPQFVSEATRLSKGVWSSRLRLYTEAFFEIRFPVPPLDERRAICQHLDAQVAKLDVLRTTATKTIGLLRGRRAALIAVAATGQMGVPQVTEPDGRGVTRC